MKRGYIISFVILKIALLISLLFDNQILNFILKFRTEQLSTFMISLEVFSAELLVFAVSLLFFSTKNKRKLIIPLVASFATAAIITLGLKHIIARPRPLVDALTSPSTFSFPSGHATFIFTPLAFFNKEYPKFKWIWLVIAIVVAFSRVYLGVHYLSDVISGSIIGFGSGNFYIYLESKYKLSKKLRKVFKR